MGRIRLEPWPVRARCAACGEVTSNEKLGEVDGGRRLRCKSCGAEWTWTAKPKRVQLSESERRKPVERRKVVACAWCGRSFVPRRKGQACCSARCREHARRDARAGLLVLMADAERLDAKMREG